MIDEDEQERVAIGQRLQNERSRLGMSQTSLGEKIGAARHTISNWESGESTPPAAMLSRMAKAGMDALYVCTGEAAEGSESTLTKEELELVAHWRWTPADRREVIMSVSKMASGR